jgi:hypothetical protein
MHSNMIAHVDDVPEICAKEKRHLVFKKAISAELKSPWARMPEHPLIFTAATASNWICMSGKN